MRWHLKALQQVTGEQTTWSGLMHNPKWYSSHLIFGCSTNLMAWHNCCWNSHWQQTSLHADSDAAQQCGWAAGNPPEQCRWGSSWGELSCAEGWAARLQYRCSHTAVLVAFVTRLLPDWTLSIHLLHRKRSWHSEMYSVHADTKADTSTGEKGSKVCMT